jgi:hypothetical protein
LIGFVRQSRAGVGTLLASLLVVTLAAWLISIARSAPKEKPTPIGPTALSEAALRAFALSARQPVYWAGPRPGDRYELTRSENGNIVIRYVGPAERAQSAGGLTVATYPYRNAFDALVGISNVQHIQFPGGTAIVDWRNTGQIYLAYRGLNYQVAIYGASPGRLLRLARSGAVRAIR